MEKYEIYIGLKDQDTHEEEFTVADFAETLAGICKKSQIGFSMTRQFGGYSHEMGYVTETSLRITLFGIEKSDVERLGMELKRRINTDAVLITEEECRYYYL